MATQLRGYFMLLMLVTFVASQTSGQSNEASANSLQSAQPDSTQSVFSSATDSLSSDSGSTKRIVKADTLLYPIADSELKAPITYTGEDSIVYDVANKLILIYGDVEVNYDQIKLNAAKVKFDWTSGTMTAEGVEDSTGKLTGKPIFTESGRSYSSRKMSYNFKSGKGKVYDVITKEGEGYLHGEQIKKNEQNEWYGSGAKYTTCDHEEPHFYIKAKKVKLVPDKLMVTGPANLYIADVPTPLYIPFGIFPAQQGRRSGVIFPQYGEVRNLGFYLQEGGYYFAINDYLSLALTGEIYSKGSWGSQLAMNYKRRYKHNGRFRFKYFRRRPVDPDLPGAASSNNYSLNWSHNQDPKARPLSSFSGSVNFETANFARENLLTDDRLLRTQLASSVRYTKTFRGKPFNLGVSMNHNQNLRTHRLNISAPVVTFNLSRIAPFKAKVSTGKPRWYEKIGFNYSGEMKSFISTADSLLFKRDALDKLKYGVRHNANVDAPFTLFKFFNVKPSFKYTERWYFQRIEKNWNPDTIYISQPDTSIDTIYGQLLTDTLFGFRSVRDFDLRLSISTKIYGIYQFNTKRVKAMRHTITPSVSFVYRPDFGSSRWNYYKQVQSDASGNQTEYSPYDIVRSVYGIPGKGLIGAVDFNLNNNFELKVLDKADTTGKTKKLGLLDRFNMSTRYNFAADSLQLNPVRLSGSSRLSKYLNFTFGFTLDPYQVNQNNRRINEFVWASEKKLLRMTRANFSLNGTFSSKSASNNSPKKGTEEERDYVTNNPNAFYDFKIPWAFSGGYNLNLNRGNSVNPDTLLITQSLNFRGNFNLTPNWKFDFSSGFDFREKEPTLTNIGVIRDLHCWQLSFNWTAYPVEFQRFNIEIRVKSSVLQELKLSKKREYIDGL